MRIPPGKSAAWVCGRYFLFLKRSIPFIDVSVAAETVSIRPFFGSVSLLRLKLLSNTEERVSYLIKGGILTRETDSPGRFDFILEKSGYIRIGVYDYCHSLPAPVYRISQYLAHEMVMLGFERYLLGYQLKKEGARPCPGLFTRRN